MTSKDIIAVLFRYWVGSRVAIPNYTGRGSNGESDLFLLTRSRYAEEVEIKISIADFRREFKTKGFKHNGLNSEKNEYWYYNFPRRFWFAVPDNIADQVERELQGTKYGLLVVAPTKSKFAPWKVVERKPPGILKCARKLEIKEVVALAVCMTARIAKLYPQPTRSE